MNEVFTPNSPRNTRQCVLSFPAVHVSVGHAAVAFCTVCCNKAMSGLSLSLCSSSRIFGSFECVSIRYSVHVLRVLSMEYCKVQAREASSVASCIHMSYLYKSCFTNAGLHPCWLDVALLCRPMRIRKDREVSQQRASSTGRVSFLDIAGRCLLWSRVDSDSNGCDSTQIAFSRKRRGLATV